MIELILIDLTKGGYFWENWFIKEPLFFYNPWTDGLRTDKGLKSGWRIPGRISKDEWRIF